MRYTSPVIRLTQSRQTSASFVNFDLVLSILYSSSFLFQSIRCVTLQKVAKLLDISKTNCYKKHLTPEFSGVRSINPRGTLEPGINLTAKSQTHAPGTPTHLQALGRLRSRVHPTLVPDRGYPITQSGSDQCSGYMLPENNHLD